MLKGTEKDNESNNTQVREEMEMVQCELREALEILVKEVGSKLKPNELDKIKAEVAELDDLLERLKTGFVWVSLFGKTSVGKSALLNAIIGQDLAEVDVGFDHTKKCIAYKCAPWMLVDMPGTMGKPNFEGIALEEAKRSHGHIFVIDGEPYQDELELFDAVSEACPDIPNIVFCNKYERLEQIPQKDREQVIQAVRKKMDKYVLSQEDIVFGSAQLYDPKTDTMIRQSVLPLIDQMYNSAGTLGSVMNVIDPAGRVLDANSQIKEKLAEVRMQIGRKVAGIFASIEMGLAFVPLSTFICTPSLLASLVFVEMKIMGKNVSKADVVKITAEGLKTCATVLAGDFVFATAASVILDTANILGPVGFLIAAAGNLTGMCWWRWKRTVIFAEVMLEYAKRDFSWGDEDAAEIIKECKRRALKYHMKFRKNKE